jgi:hypothetical protein
MDHRDKASRPLGHDALKAEIGSSLEELGAIAIGIITILDW